MIIFAKQIIPISSWCKRLQDVATLSWTRLYDIYLESNIINCLCQVSHLFLIHQGPMRAQFVELPDINFSISRICLVNGANTKRIEPLKHCSDEIILQQKWIFLFHSFQFAVSHMKPFWNCRGCQNSVHMQTWCIPCLWFSALFMS